VGCAAALDATHQLTATNTIAVRWLTAGKHRFAQPRTATETREQHAMLCANFALENDRTADDSEEDTPAGLRTGWFDPTPATYWLARFVLLRAVGFIYVVAFVVLLQQQGGLIGSHGIAPAAVYLERIRDQVSWWDPFSVFWLDASDASLTLGAWIGFALALAVLAGVENVLVMLALWLLYMSYAHVGQIFWGYGWEILLLETGFLAIFLCPLRTMLPLRNLVPTPLLVIWMLRWLIFRVMFGAGLIKIRGDACWTDLTCLVYHYETQPNPHPLSWLLHQAPVWFHQLGVGFNHIVELVAPFLAFGPRVARHTAGALFVAFQAMLILSGNLSFLNWLTLVVALACFDDGLWRRILPARLVARADQLERDKRTSRPQTIVVPLVAVVVAVLSVDPIANMLSRRQRMNSSFDPFHLVNTYGAFGSVTKVRNEVIIEGTLDASPGPNAQWREYAFVCKPGDVKRAPCVITPYHHRIDWQMWFAALPPQNVDPWFAHLVYKLLVGERVVLDLLADNPFPHEPPRFVRAQHYRYRFTTFGEEGWWKRELVGEYLPPLHAKDTRLLDALARYGWGPRAQQ
jgi:hypothetical protein